MILQAVLTVLLLSTVHAQSSSPTIPTSVPCPTGTPLVRSAGTPGNQTLSSAESNYISQRAQNVLPGAWKTYIQNVANTSSTALPGYISIIANSSSPPKLGIAVSGGGYRAALFGAGVLSSLDGRNETASSKTGTGGLLQAASYLSGLSGGSWLVTALAQANFPTIPDLVFPPQGQTGTSVYGGFNAQTDLINPGPQANDTASYIAALFEEVEFKRAKSGFPLTITDLWSRAIARHFVNGTTPQNILSPGAHGAGVLFSDIASVPSFVAHGQPFPIIVADSFSPKPNRSELLPGEDIPLTDEIWEFNVYETGSFDPMLSSFIPTPLLGSTNTNNCVIGFEQASYIAAISSNIFPELNITETAIDTSSIGPLIVLINSVFPRQGVRLDSAAVPNPFFGVNPSTYANTNQTYVALADGGLDGEVIPLQPLLVQARGVDTIFAVDASADEQDNYTNGTEIITSAKRASLFGKTYPFPSVPGTPEVFVSQNLTRRPTFFGCNDTSGAPLIVYVANGGPPAGVELSAGVTNTSTQQGTYGEDEIRAFLDQAFTISTQGAPVGGNKTDADWGVCLACAIFDRARAKSGAAREGVCTGCFERYCWVGNGTSAKSGGVRGVSLGVRERVLAAAAVVLVLALGIIV